jgi:hypothetical protein
MRRVRAVNGANQSGPSTMDGPFLLRQHESLSRTQLVAKATVSSGLIDGHAQAVFFGHQDIHL